MSWQLALALAIIMGVVRVLYMRRYAQKSKLPATIPPAVSYLFGVLPVGIVAGLFIFPNHIEWTWTVILFMVILSASMALSNWLGFVAASKIAAAPQQTIGMLTNISVVLMGWTLLGETLTMQQFVGGGILLFSVMLAIWAPVKTSTGDFKRLDAKTLVIAVTSAILLAVGLVTEKVLLDDMEIGGIFLVSWTAQAFGMALLAAKDMSRPALKLLKGGELRTSTILGISNGLNGVLYIYTLFHSDNISLVTIIGAVSFPLTILGAYLFLHEREHHRIMWLSLAVAVVGLIAISL